MDVVVAELGRAHGLKGELAVRLRTDSPEVRFTKGAVFALSPARGSKPGARRELEDQPPVDLPREVRLVRARETSGKWFVRFAEVDNRTLAERLNGFELSMDIDLEIEQAEDPDAWYPDELKGLLAVLPDGTAAGTVTGLEHLPAQDLLVLEQPSGEVARVPFVRELVPEVDVRAKRVVIDPPDGLLEARPGKGE